MIELLIQAEGALSVGLLDRAEGLYRQVAAADPRNSIAIVGLSRVALERGRQHEALVLARQALTIDGENVAAQRMVQRLEEVLAFRGDGVRSGTVGQIGQVGHPVPEPPPSVLEPKPEAQPTPPERPAVPPEAQRASRSWLDRLRGRR